MQSLERGTPLKRGIDPSTQGRPARPLGRQETAVLHADDAAGPRAMSASCVTTTTVLPPSPESESRSSMISAPVAESRLPVGSSASTTCGSFASARAIATRCCSPPESLLGTWSARAARPTDSSRSRTFSAAPRRRPVGASAISTFCAAVSVGIRLNCWKTKPNVRSRSCRARRRPSARCPALEEDLARGRPVERAEQLEQRRLARPARADDGDGLARVDRRSTSRTAWTWSPPSA